MKFSEFKPVIFSELTNGEKFKLFENDQIFEKINNFTAKNISNNHEIKVSKNKKVRR